MIRTREKKDMFEIKITLDATHTLLAAIRAVADALAPSQRHDALPDPEQERIFQRLDALRHDFDAYAREMAEITDAPETAPESPAVPIASEAPAETPAAEEEPKKRKPRAKKQAEQEEAPKAAAEEPKAEPAVEEPKAQPAEVHAEEVAQPVKEEISLEGNDEALAGKGQTGDILSELTQKAIGDLDRLGVSRSDANRRIREYCGANGIKIPTFPALLQAVGYAAALDICKG